MPQNRHFLCFFLDLHNRCHFEYAKCVMIITQNVYHKMCNIFYAKCVMGWNEASPLSRCGGCGDGLIWDVVVGGLVGRNVGHIGERLTRDGELEVLALERAVDDLALTAEIDIQVGEGVALVAGFSLGSSNGVAR